MTDYLDRRAQVAAEVRVDTLPESTVQAGKRVLLDTLGDARAPTIRKVINLAASMSPANSWTPALAGATIRNLYPGRSGLAGILAVDLQRCGFTGLDDAPSDVYATILGDRFDPARAVDGLGERYRIEQ